MPFIPSLGVSRAAGERGKHECGNARNAVFVFVGAGDAVCACVWEDSRGEKRMVNKRMLSTQIEARPA